MVEPGEGISSFAGDDGEVGGEFPLVVDEEGEFADGHAVAEGDFVDADEGSGLGVDGAFDEGADGVGAVEDDEADFGGGGGFEAMGEGGDVGVEAAADVLDVENEGVEAGELGGGGGAAVAIEAVDGEAGGGVGGVGDFRLVEVATDTVFGGEEGNEGEIFGLVEEVDGGASVAVVAAGVGDEADAEAVELAEVVAGEDVNAVEDRGGRGGGFWGRGEGVGFQCAGDVEEVVGFHGFCGEGGEFAAEAEDVGAAVWVVAVAEEDEEGA